MTERERPSGATDLSVGGHPVRGVDVDSETRCVHWASDRDVIAIRAPCCGTYYPCSACHDELADHPLSPIPEAEFDEAGVLCGVCDTALTVREYLDADHTCPRCGASFNPGCAAHYDRYFEGV